MGVTIDGWLNGKERRRVAIYKNHNIYDKIKGLTMYVCMFVPDNVEN